MQNNQPTISIITVCLNAADKLQKTLESLVRQTYPWYEHIIIDGESSDASVNLIQEHAKLVSCRWLSEPDGGIYSAMNKGIKLATGDYILFLNAGDWLVSPNAIEFFLSKADLVKADLLFGRILWEDPASRVIIPSDHAWSRYHWHLLRSNFPQPATFYKRSLFERVGYFDESFQIYADYAWNANALIYHRLPFQYLNQIVTVFRADGVSNQPGTLTRRQEEMQRITASYFQPAWLFKKLGRPALLAKKSLAEYSLARLYDKKLNRIGA